MLTIGFTCIIISSCNKSITDDTPADFHTYIDSGYLINVPLGFKYAEKAPSDEYYYFGYPIDVKNVVRSIEFYNSEISTCTPFLTGASTMIELPDANGFAVWGRMDFFKMYSGEGGIIDHEGERPLCAQPSSSENRYAFCSEKNGKTIVICIEQSTDDSKLAEEIFQTFRWIE